MSARYAPVLPQRRLHITGVKNVSDALVDAFVGPLMRTADRVAAAILSGRIDKEGIEAHAIKAIRVEVWIRAHSPSRGMTLAASSTTAPKSQFWLPLASRIDADLKAHLKAPFEPLAAALSAAPHAPRHGVFEYTAGMPTLSSHEAMRLHAA